MNILHYIAKRGRIYEYITNEDHNVIMVNFRQTLTQKMIWDRFNGK